MYSQIEEWRGYLSREDELIEQHLGKAVVLRDGKVQHVCDGIAEAVAWGTEQYGDEQFIARRIDGSRESDERYLSATHRLRTNLARMWNESESA